MSIFLTKILNQFGLLLKLLRSKSGLLPPTRQNPWRENVAAFESTTHRSAGFSLDRVRSSPTHPQNPNKERGFSGLEGARGAAPASAFGGAPGEGRCPPGRAPRERLGLRYPPAASQAQRRSFGPALRRLPNPPARLTFINSSLSKHKLSGPRGRFIAPDRSSHVPATRLLLGDGRLGGGGRTDK